MRGRVDCAAKEFMVEDTASPEATELQARCDIGSVAMVPLRSSAALAGPKWESVASQWQRLCIGFKWFGLTGSYIVIICSCRSIAA